MGKVLPQRFLLFHRYMVCGAVFPVMGDGSCMGMVPPNGQEMCRVVFLSYILKVVIFL